MSPFWRGFVSGLAGEYKPRLWGFILGFGTALTIYLWFGVSS